MALALIGRGIGELKDISQRGMGLIENASLIYVEAYTTHNLESKKELERFFGKDIIYADRKLVEEDALKIIENAKNCDVCLLVGGDPFAATTHINLLLLAKSHKVKVEVVHNASIFTAVGITGLQLYKFGKTTSLPFPYKNELSYSTYESIKTNNEMGLHSLVLLDLIVDEDKYMTILEAVKLLEKVEKERKEGIFKKDTLVVACARLGREDEKIVAGPLKSVHKAKFGDAPHALIIPGKLHFAEEEALKKLYWVKK